LARPRNEHQILIAKQSGVIQIDGEECFVVKGVTRAERGAEIVRLTPGWWEPIKAHYRVEQATAAPGELRGE
jgi:hypothetical protein